MKARSLFNSLFLMHVALTIILVVCVVFVSYELFSSWILSSLLGFSAFWIYKYFKGKKGRKMWRLWEGTLSSYQMGVSEFPKSDYIEGVGFIDNSTLLLRVHVSDNGVRLHNKWAIDCSCVYLKWNILTTVSTRVYRYDGIVQRVADICITDNPDCKLVIPWDDEFDKFVPGTVGLDKVA